MDPIQITIAAFVFILGACVGSFLNVVVYRLPRVDHPADGSYLRGAYLSFQSLIHPPSTCPNCQTRLAAYDNVPIFGWLWLRGKCRYCRNPISARYPIVEFATAAVFLFHFLMLFAYGWGPYETKPVQDVFGMWVTQVRVPGIERDWPVLVLHLWLIGALIAASLIDLEHFIIPLEICWITAIVGVFGHAFLIGENQLGSVHMGAPVDALTLGAGIGLLVSLGLLQKGIFKRSFESDAPLMEHELKDVPEDQRPDPWPKSRIRQEMRREMIFLFPPIALGAVAAALVMSVPAIGNAWANASDQPIVSGALGSLFGALIGGAVVWFFRIAGSYGFGREAMGLGDVHLMFGVGAIIGGGASTVAFFLAPLFGLTIAILQLLTKGRREIPYGPYLSLATYAVLLFYTPIREYLAPGMEGLLWMFGNLIGNGAA